ncbi:minor tail protein [Microbacterium phage Floof]|uniref:Minor tail protein n=1 Tax=Microbacterium phage Floof TaxID=2201433 RepID=A0A2Z4Q4H2_9CAUD|nr:minor tail protein [Microbacterium phage Floof]
MIASDLVVEVRDVNLARQAQLTDADLSGLIIATRQNDVGSWQLTLPDTVLDEASGKWVKHAAAQHLRKEGAGIIVTAPGPGATFETLISGPMTSATYVADENDLTGTWTFTGVSDLVLLADAVAFPQPSNANPSTQAVAYDKRTGNAEDLIRQYVAYNVASSPNGSWAPAGRLTGFRNRLTLRGTSEGRGPTLTKSARFDNLLELCQGIAFQGNLNFDIVQVGTALELVITTPTDRTKTIRMDMANQLLKSVTYGYGAPTTTLAVVAGKGEGTARRVLSRTSSDATSSEQRWGRRVERFIDQRQSDEDTELVQKGDEEVLAGAASATGLQASPTDSDAMLYLRDWRTGDRISVVIEGQEVAAKVTEAAISVEGSAVIFVATLGDPGAFDVDAASDRRANATNSRVSALERIAEVPVSSAPAWDQLTGKPTTFPTTWDSVASKPSTFPASPQLTGTREADALPSDWPQGLSATFTTPTGWPTQYGVVFTMRHSDVRTAQLITEKTTGRMWSRAATDGSTWGDFHTVLQDSVAWTELTGKPTTFAPSAHNHSAADITSGLLSVARVPHINETASNGRTYFGTGPAASGAGEAHIGLSPLADTSTVYTIWGAVDNANIFAFDKNGRLVLGTVPASAVSEGTLAAARLPAASDTVAGAVERATQAEVNAGTDGSRYITPATLRQSTNLPYAMAAGSFVTNTELGVEAYKDYTVTFPSGRFNTAPIVTFGAGSVRAGVACEVTPTSTGMTVRVFNVSGASTVSSGTVIRWQAVQMSPSAAGG